MRACSYVKWHDFQVACACGWRASVIYSVNAWGSEWDCGTVLVHKGTHFNPFRQAWQHHVLERWIEQAMDSQTLIVHGLDAG